MLYVTTCAATLAVGFLVSITGLDAKYKPLFEICCLALECLYLIISLVLSALFVSDNLNSLDYPIISSHELSSSTSYIITKKTGEDAIHVAVPWVALRRKLGT